jgi:hypothetical protein
MLKRALLMTFLVAGLVACDDDSPTAPADPNVIVFTAQLAASNEVPPITNAESGARGDVRITFNLTRDATNAITGGTATFVVNLNSFPAGSTWTLAHIHEGAAGVAGGVRVNTDLSPSTAIALPNGTVSNQTFSNKPIGSGTSDPALINAILANPAGYYFNVHTTLNPSGAVRGQLVRQ